MPSIYIWLAAFASLCSLGVGIYARYTKRARILEIKRKMLEERSRHASSVDSELGRLRRNPLDAVALPFQFETRMPLNDGQTDNELELNLQYFHNNMIEQFLSKLHSSRETELQVQLQYASKAYERAAVQLASALDKIQSGNMDKLRRLQTTFPLVKESTMASIIQGAQTRISQQAYSEVTDAFSRAMHLRERAFQQSAYQLEFELSSLFDSIRNIDIPDFIHQELLARISFEQFEQETKVDVELSDFVQRIAEGTRFQETNLNVDPEATANAKTSMTLATHAFFSFISHYLFVNRLDFKTNGDQQREQIVQSLVSDGFTRDQAIAVVNSVIMQIEDRTDNDPAIKRAVAFVETLLQ